MEVPVKSGMALYYKKLIELQEKLRERERAHCKKLQFQCRKLIDKDRRRQERNDEIVRSLEEIEMRMHRLTSKTKDLETFKFSNYPLQKYRDLQSGEEEWKKTLSTSNHNNFEDYDDKTQIRTINSDLDKNPKQRSGEEWKKKLYTSNNNILGRYDDKTQTRTTNSDWDENLKQSSEGEWKKNLPISNDNNFGSFDDKTQIRSMNSDLEKNPKQTIYPHRFNKTSDDLNSLAEYMTNSISSRYYKKDGLESTPHPNHSIHSSIKDFEKGMHDEQEKQKINEFSNPHMPDVPISHDTQIGVNDEEFGELGKNEIYSSSLEKRRDIEQEINNRSLNRDQNNYKILPNEDDSVNKGDMKIIQDSSKTGIVANTDADRKTTNDWSHTKNVKNSDRSGNNGEVIFDKHLDKKEVQIPQVNYEQSISGLNTQNASKTSESPRKRENLEANKAHVPNDEDKISEEVLSSQMTDKNHTSSYTAEKEPFDDHDDSQINQRFYPDGSTQVNQQPNDGESNQFLQTQYEKPSEELFEDHNQPSEEQFDEHVTPAMYSEMRYDEHGQLAQSNKQYPHYDETEQSDQYPDSSNYLTNSHERNAKNEDAVPEVESHEQKQKALGGNGEKPEISDTSASRVENPNNLLGEKVSPNNMNERSFEDANHPAANNEQFQIENHNLSQDLHSDNQNEPQTYQFEDSGQHAYNENVQPIPQYDENGQLLQEYDQNAMYQYEQQYDNSAHNYGEHNEEYQQQYGQYDEGQIYQQTEGMHATGEEAQHYMNQDGQYDEHNPTPQNYQYSEEPGVYMDPNAQYEDQQPSQIYQSSGEIHESGGNVDEDMSQVEQYDQTDHMPSQAYQQPDTNVTGVEGIVDQLLPNASESDETK